jgi:hypothetical protein
MIVSLFWSSRNLTGGSGVSGKAGPIWVGKVFNCLLTRARIRAPFDDKIILLNDSKTITLEVEFTVRGQAA